MRANLFALFANFCASIFTLINIRLSLQKAAVKHGESRGYIVEFTLIYSTFYVLEII